MEIGALLYSQVDLWMGYTYKSLRLSTDAIHSNGDTSFAGVNVLNSLSK